MTPEYNDFDDMTVDEAKESLADADESDLRDILVYEQSHKDRVTLIRWIQERLDIDVLEEFEERLDDLSEEYEPDEIRVTNGEDTGFIAGETFRRPYDTRVMPNNARTQRAIDNGKLEKTVHQPDQ